MALFELLNETYSRQNEPAMKPMDISNEKFSAMADALAKAGEENDVDPFELLAFLVQMQQLLTGGKEIKVIKKDS